MKLSNGRLLYVLFGSACLLELALSAPMNLNHHFLGESSNPVKDFWNTPFASHSPQTNPSPLHETDQDYVFPHPSNDYHDLGKTPHLDVNQINAMWNTQDPSHYHEMAFDDYNYQHGHHSPLGFNEPMHWTPDHSFDQLHVHEAPTAEASPDQSQSSQHEHVSDDSSRVSDEGKDHKYYWKAALRTKPHDKKYEKLNEYKWQEGLSNKGTMKVFKTIISQWDPAVKVTNRGSIDRLNAFLENYPDLVPGILKKDKEAIAQVLKATEHKSRPWRGGKRRDIEPPDDLLKWLKAPKYDRQVKTWNENSWTPTTMDYVTQQAFVKALHIAWMRDIPSTKEQLKDLNREDVEAFLDRVLSKNPQQVSVAAQLLKELISVRRKEKKAEEDKAQAQHYREKAAKKVPEMQQNTNHGPQSQRLEYDLGTQYRQQHYGQQSQQNLMPEEDYRLFVNTLHNSNQPYTGQILPDGSLYHYPPGLP